MLRRSAPEEPRRGPPAALRLADILLGGLLLLAVAVVALHPYPPANDASSHIATAWIAAHLLQGDLATAAWYSFDLIPLPYWTPTLVMTPLVDLLGPLGAWGVLMVSVAVGFALALRALLSVAGPGNRVLAPIGALLVFNHAYYLGEAAYLVGLPLAFGAVALFARLERFGARWWAFATLTLLTTLSHIFALALLTGGVICLAVCEHLPGPLRSAAPAGAQRGARLAGLGIALAAMATASWWVVGQHGTSANTGELVFDMSTWRLVQVISNPLGHPATSAWPPVLAAAGLGLLSLRALAVSRAVHPAFALSALGCLVLAWLGPAGIQEPYGFEDIGERFAIGAVVFGLAAVRWPARDPRLLGAALAVTIAWAAWKVPVTWQAHAAHQPRMQELEEAVLARIPEGAMVLPLMDIDEPDVADFAVHRLVNYAVFRRRAYSPHVFARTGQQPLRHVLIGDYRRVDDLDVEAQDLRRYDHVLVQTDVPGESRVEALLGRTREIARAGGFRFYELLTGDD